MSGLQVSASEDRFILASHASVESSLGVIRVPKGFSFDGASIPQALWSLGLDPFNPRFLHASCVHDWLYYTHQIHSGELSRGQVDTLFGELLVKAGVDRVRVWSMVKAVRMFGGWYWPNDDQDRRVLADLRASLELAGDDLRQFGLA